VFEHSSFELGICLGLGKFGSAQEFTQFLQTENGKRFIEDTLPKPPNLLGKVLRFLQAGVLFVMIGFGYRINAGSVPP